MQSLRESKDIRQSSRKRRKSMIEFVLLVKTKLNTIEVLVSKALIDSYINHDEFVSINNVLREYKEMKE